MLSEILSLLPNLRVVAFGDWEVPTEDVYNDKVNYFDKDMHSHTLTHGYPKNEAAQYEDAYFPHSKGFREINVVFRALADSQKPIEGFFVRSYSLYDNGIDLQRVARMTSPLSEGLSEVFKRLRTLHLSLGELSEYESQEDEADKEPLDDNDQGTLWLAEFLALTPQVEDLTLSFYDCQNGSMVFSEFVTRADLPKLNKFGMHFTFVDPGDLTTFLLMHRPTLQDITLRHRCFMDHQWSEFLSDTFLDTDWNPTITLARLGELESNVDHSQSSVLFDTDHLHDCCWLGSGNWSYIRGKDCEHVSRTVQPKDLLNLKMTNVDRSDPK